MKSLLFYFLFFVSYISTAQIQLLGVDDFKKIEGNKNVLIVDVRTPYEYNSGHIQGAINIDYYATNFKTKLSKLDHTYPIYIYCHSGVRSAKAAHTLKSLNFSKIYDLDGGIVAWKKAGYKTVR
ncbi:MAG: rhodanese-like domain-containing protein [Flavobacteriales bacterium CG_4_9_14_3_um_filter_40_17]|nr:MAG: rhodanese-like domain-containing protein [Flavobacteriales bacterium CG_4_9_14_3_um_filter_40_17]